MAVESGVVRVVWYSLRRHTLHGRQGRSLPTVSPKHSSSIHRTGGAWGRGAGTDC